MTALTHQPGDPVFHVSYEEWERACAADPTPLEMVLCGPDGQPVDPASGAESTLPLSTAEQCVARLVPAEPQTPVEALPEKPEEPPAREPKPGGRGRK